jgi:hypothetical protein
VIRITLHWNRVLLSVAIAADPRRSAAPRFKVDMVTMFVYDRILSPLHTGGARAPFCLTRPRKTGSDGTIDTEQGNGTTVCQYRLQR